MGPVSFETLDVGNTRAAALDAASQLGQAGIRVVSLSPGGSGLDLRFQIMVRSDDAQRAREILDSIQP
jgi:hypothetical protein